MCCVASLNDNDPINGENKKVDVNGPGNENENDHDHDDDYPPLGLSSIINKWKSAGSPIDKKLSPSTSRWRVVNPPAGHTYPTMYTASHQPMRTTHEPWEIMASKTITHGIEDIGISGSCSVEDDPTTTTIDHDWEYRIGFISP